ncbi:hypothetical protein L1987_57742 [Smallanthus sonchifolius]|uniref:Uncharacterized protein n=1 Tax=Smallanthus sonchifolius TaxID=185202 RepID=A0ACB9DDD3_9ASTR|nr:hypothetical protein L1987_57742 [Smallanthus sonchifolius]
MEEELAEEETAEEEDGDERGGNVELEESKVYTQPVFVEFGLSAALLGFKNSGKVFPAGVVWLVMTDLVRAFVVLECEQDKNNMLKMQHLVDFWVESMRASSPIQNSPERVDHPPSCALRLFDEIANASKGKQVVMFLDYDGTLSPIVNDPDRAYMSDEMRATIRKLADCFPTAIVTGRCLDKVRNFVNLD